MSTSDTWLNSHNWNERAPGPMGKKKEAWFQRELDKIVGVEPNGVKRFKLEWGQESMIWDAFRGEWNYRLFWGKPDVEYKANNQGIIVPRMKVIGVPRYFLLGFTGQYTPRELQRDGLSLDGVDVVETPDGLEFQERHTRYRATPHLPQYRIELIFASHQKRKNPTDPYAPCCVHRMMNFDKGYNRCYGRYVEPDESDINSIKAEMNWYAETFRQAHSGAISESQYEYMRKTEENRRIREEEQDKIDREYAIKHNAGALHKATQKALTGARLWSNPTLTTSKI